MGASLFGGIYDGIRDGYLIINTDSYLRNYFIAIAALMTAGFLAAVGYVVAHFSKNSESENYNTVAAVLLLLGQIMPTSLSRIGEYAFYGCGDLHDIVYAGTSSDWNTVDKGCGWCLATHGLVVHCLDKKITP